MLTVKLNGAAPNPSAIGGQVVLHSGNHVQRSEVQSGGGFGSTDSYSLEFGLGKRTQVDSLKVFWPSGEMVQYGPLPADQPLEFHQSK